MKTSAWIKLIGILCIVFGALGIISHISSFFMPQWMMDTWPEVPPVRQKWMVRLEFIGIVVNTIYLLAGIFFLRKKPFSLMLMYFALTISLLYVVIPWFFFKPYDELIFVAISPIIDLCLLILVYRIRNYYDASPDEIVKLFGESKLSPSLLKLLAFFGVLCVSIPILLQGLWIYVFSITDNYSDAVAILQSYYPEFLNGPFATIYISIAFCLLSIIVSIITRKVWKTLNTLVLICGSLLLFLNLFQLM